MKILFAGLVVFLFAVSAAAQDQPAPDVMVLDKKWTMEVRILATEKDPFQANKDRLQEESEQRARAEENENRIRQGQNALPPAVHQPKVDPGRKRLVTYIYEAKLRNTGLKKIRTVIWEFVFREPGTTEEVGRRRFVSRVSLEPGGTRHVVIRTPLPPTRNVDATKAGMKPSDQYFGQVVITNVLYSDGSVWAASQFK